MFYLFIAFWILFSLIIIFGALFVKSSLTEIDKGEAMHIIDMAGRDTDEDEQEG